jgi:hypothetical protein
MYRVCVHYVSVAGQGKSVNDHCCSQCFRLLHVPLLCSITVQNVTNCRSYTATQKAKPSICTLLLAPTVTVVLAYVAMVLVSHDGASHYVP